MPTLTQVGTAHLPAPWRAVCVILCEQFGRDRRVWARVQAGESIDLAPEVADVRRPMAERLMLATAQSIIDGTTLVPVGRLFADLSDRQLRSVIDALAIARGSLPID